MNKLFHLHPVWAGFFIIAGTGIQLSGADPSATEISFKRDIAPILLENCQGCHGPKESKGDYRLDSYEHLTTPGSSDEPAVTRGEPNRSKLYRLITAEDELDRMPQKADPLSEESIEKIDRWIRQGAHYDGLDPQAALVTIVPQRPFPQPPEVYPYPMPILALAFRPDGRELAVSGYHEITVWDAAKGDLLRRITNVTQRIHSLEFHPYGRWLAGAGGAPGRIGEATLYDPESGTVEQVLATTPGVMLTVAFSPEGDVVAVGGADHAIHLFEQPGGRELRVIQQHADWVTGLAFSPDGRHLASASRDRSARVYEVQTGRLETTYNEHEDAVYDVAFSPDGSRVFSAGADRKIHQWKIEDGKRTAEFGRAEEPILQLLRVDEQLFSCSADRKIRQYNAETREHVRTYAGLEDWVYAVAYDSSTARLAGGSHDGEICVWDTGNGEVITRFTASPGHWRSAQNRAGNR